MGFGVRGDLPAVGQLILLLCAAGPHFTMAERPPSRVEECFDVTVNDTICVPGNVSVREVRIEAHKGQQDAEDV